MEKLHDWDVFCVSPHLDTMIRHVKSIISDGMDKNDHYQKSLASAPSITGEILVFTDLGEKDLKLAMELTSKPYLNSHGNS